MPSKLQTTVEMVAYTAKDICSHPEVFTAFLETAANNYKYGFRDQMLIFAQKPNATACAEIEVWNKLGRYVNRGTKGIALLVDRNVPYRLRHVFDIADTNSFHGNEVKLWQMKPEYEEAVTEALENSFGEVDNKTGFADVLLGISELIVSDNFSDYCEKLKSVKHGSFLEEVDDLNTEVYFRGLLKNSVAYMLLTRCGYDAAEYAQNVNHVSISNLAFKYATFSPFTLGNNKEIEMFDLEISWIGGRLFTKRENNYILYGNALEFWYRAYDISVKRCWIHQIFDAALTFQGFGDDRPEFINIDFSDNLIEYCSMNFEFWAGNQGDGFESIIENIYFAKNIIRFGGYGWGGIQRPDKGDQALILGWNRLYNQMKNFVVTDNILDCADGNIIFTKGPNEQKGLTVNNNTYYQKAHVPTHKFNEIVRGSGQCASNQAEFEREIAQFEISPKKVEWLTD